MTAGLIFTVFVDPLKSALKTTDSAELLKGKEAARTASRASPLRIEWGCGLWLMGINAARVTPDSRIELQSPSVLSDLLLC
jgi:hypothetical protein